MPTRFLRACMLGALALCACDSAPPEPARREASITSATPPIRVEAPLASTPHHSTLPTYPPGPPSPARLPTNSDEAGPHDEQPRATAPQPDVVYPVDPVLAANQDAYARAAEELETSLAGLSPEEAEEARANLKREMLGF